MGSPAQSIFETVLDFPVISRIRRNHGLEHASLHMLSRRHPRCSLAGHSDSGGFWLIGDVPTEDVYAAVEEALLHLRNGEYHLAVHPNCGTNFVSAGILAGLGAFIGLLGARRFREKLERLPLVATLATLALILAQPLGLLLQEQITTAGELGNLEVVEIIPSRRGRLRAHRVVTRG